MSHQPTNVVPANAGTHTPGPIDVRLELTPNKAQRPVVMGPRVRGDDEERHTHTKRE
jgi:hypothetical protein